MKKTIIAVITVALITALFIGCNFLPDDLNLDKKQEQSVSNGKIKVRLNLGNPKSNARTIYPDTTSYEDASKFPGFVLFIEDTINTGYVIYTPDPSDGNPNPDPITSDLTDPPFNYVSYSEILEIELDPGTYIFTAFALDAKSSAGKFLAWGQSDDDGDPAIDITTFHDVNIILKEIIYEKMDSVWNTFVSVGKFTWNIPVSSYTAASLTLTGMPGGPYDFDEIGHTSKFTLNLKASDVFTNNNVGALEKIPSGYYMMVLTLAQAKHQTEYVREMIHIWSGLETIYIPGTTAPALPTLRSNVHVVTFNYNDEGLNSGPEDGEINHGAAFSTLGNSNPSNSDTSRYSFQGWFYDDVFTALKKVNDTDKIINPLEVWAKWNKIPLASDYNVGNQTQEYGRVVAVTITPKPGAGVASPGAPGNIEYNSLSALPSARGVYPVTFDVPAASDTPYNWDAATSLSAGNLTITVGTPISTDFHILKESQTIGHFDNTSMIANIHHNPGMSTGVISNIRYGTDADFSQASPTSTPPSAVGTYHVFFNIAATGDGNWNAAINLHAGTINVVAPTLFMLTWSSEDSDLPDLDYNRSHYDPSDKLLYIDIGYTNDESSGSGFEWYVGFIPGAAIDQNDNEADDPDYQLKLTLDAEVDLGWSVPGPFRIMILDIDSKKNKTFEYTVIPAAPVGP